MLGAPHSLLEDREQYRHELGAQRAVYEPWAAERARARRAEAEAKQAREEEARRQEAVREEERRRLSAEREAAKEAARRQADSALVERLLSQAQRPRITESDAADWPPPYPYQRRCRGHACACKRYVYMSHLADLCPRRCKLKDPFACRGTHKDPWACESPCDGERVHFPQGARYTLSMSLWYAQVTGEPWLRDSGPI